MSTAHSSASRYGKSLAGCMHHARVSTDERLQRSPMHSPVLVLNASYEPINVCAARRAIVLVLKGVAMMEEANGHHLHAARIAINVPPVIRLLDRRIPHQTARCRGRTSCCAIATPANTAARFSPPAS